MRAGDKRHFSQCATNDTGQPTSSHQPGHPSNLEVKKRRYNETHVDQDILDAHPGNIEQSHSDCVCESQVCANHSPEQCTGLASDESILVQLCDMSMWQEFDRLTNEMIITKAGRRMFPIYKVQITGLKPSMMYTIALRFQQIGGQRWKFVDGRWCHAKTKSITREYFKDNRENELNEVGMCLSDNYVHQLSPNFGSYWMSEPISFSDLKLTNRTTSGVGRLGLRSLEMYIPELVVFKLKGAKVEAHHTTSFDVTKFMAVTAYQNDQVTSLKIRYNPFAKAFKGRGPQSTSKRKRKHNDSEIIDSEGSMFDTVSSVKRERRASPCEPVIGQNEWTQGQLEVPQIYFPQSTESLARFNSNYGYDVRDAVDSQFVQARWDFVMNTPLLHGDQYSNFDIGGRRIEHHHSVPRQRRNSQSERHGVGQCPAMDQDRYPSSALVPPGHVPQSQPSVVHVYQQHMNHIDQQRPYWDRPSSGR